MDSTTLTVLIAIAFLILAVITSFISARVGQRDEPELIDFPGSGLLIKPRHKKMRFSREWWSNWIQGLSTELVGAAIATLLIGVVVGAVQKNEADESLKRQLIIQMGSPNNAFAVEAARQLRTLGWFEDGSLKGANLLEANLEGVKLGNGRSQEESSIGISVLPTIQLWEHILELKSANLTEALLASANLRRASLEYVNFQKANLNFANLEEADLNHAFLVEATLVAVNLKNAHLEIANLQGASLRFADLQGADLSASLRLEWIDPELTNLQHANLKDANLLGADLTAVRFNESTILPDGTNWTPETDMSRFTDPNHPQFWRSANPASPAYGGNNNP